MSSDSSNYVGSLNEDVFRGSVLPEGVKSFEFLLQASAMQEVDRNFTSIRMQDPRLGELTNYGDPHNSYDINSLGYRSNEFDEVPLLIAGCSVTFGVGVPVEGSWAYLLAKKLNLKYSNLAAPGWSAQAIVDNILKYIWKHGKPKTLAVLFPDYSRAIAVKNYPDISVEHQILLNKSFKDRPKYIKTSQEYVDYIPPEHGLVQSFKAINFLIAYCKDQEINLAWSTWNDELEEMIVLAKNNWNHEGYKSYVPRPSVPGSLAMCHEEYLEKYQENFNRGLDGTTTNRSDHHPGVHHHVHIAESFYDFFAI